ncbi:MarR family transcriptional regulator, partial [bacterium]|nr:MarR family transcriptional regulator [bacterium]
MGIPLKAIREAIVNAIIHRDYSIMGSDIKIAIFDDMLEITSPGSLMPSVDPEMLKNTPSEVRNRVIAPIFKDCKLIEQWGSGFNKIYDDLAEYPEITMKINEPGLSFQMQFIKNDYVGNEESTLNEGLNEGLSGEKGGEKNRKDESDMEFQSIFGESAVYFRSIFGVNVFRVLMIITRNPEKTAQDIADELSLSKRTVENYFAKLKAAKYIDRKGSDKTG